MADARQGRPAWVPVTHHCRDQANRPAQGKAPGASRQAPSRPANFTIPFHHDQTRQGEPGARPEKKKNGAPLAVSSPAPGNRPARPALDGLPTRRTTPSSPARSRPHRRYRSPATPYHRTSAGPGHRSQPTGNTNARERFPCFTTRGQGAGASLAAGDPGIGGTGSESPHRQGVQSRGP